MVSVSHNHFLKRLTSSHQYTTSVNASILQPSIPVFTTLFALILRIETLGISFKTVASKMLGIGSSVAGAIVVVALHDNSNSTEASNTVLGNIFLILNCVSFSLYALLQKRILERYPPFTVAAWAYLIGTGLLVLTMADITDGDRWHIPLEALYALAYAGCLSSALAMAMLTWANRRTSPTFVTAFWPAQVVATALLSAVFLDYRLAASDAIGAALVVAGLFLVLYARYRQSKETSASLPVSVCRPPKEDDPLIKQTYPDHHSDDHLA
eukprot:Colp12_sorted_trinity150504_noHs@7281